jgi:phenylalanyl-tRNA synthetase alpha chain
MQDALEKLASEMDAYPLDSDDAIESFRVRFLGRKSGAITDLFKQIAQVPPADRRDFGQNVNALKQRAESRIEEARAVLDAAASNGRAADIDLTLPGRALPAGTVHPLTQTLDDIRGIFERFGFEMATGPEIEDDWHNFTALNFPPDHPARDMQDTFFIEAPPDGEGVLLRTHTSPVQIRVMKAEKPPIRVIVPGRVYRNESISYKSFCLFNQVEGLYIDEGVTFADLKQLLYMFATAVFGDDVQIRFRASYFPFTEPSAEVDVWWKKEDHPDGGMWMEILGCGMVDPAVLDAVGIDSERYTGYAFGLGVDRMAMRRYGIDDIRILYENDLRFLRQF